MLWLFDCQRTFVHDVVNIKIVHDVMNVITYHLTLIHNISDVVYFKDIKGRNIVVNKAFEELVGLKGAEIIGKTDKQLFPPELAKCCGKSDRAVFKKGEALRFDEEFTDREGGKRYFDTIKSPIFDDKGKLVGLMGVSREITEYVHIEEELKLFKDLINQSNDAIFVTDPKTSRFLDVNDKACTNLGYSREELLKMEVVDIETMIPNNFSWKKHIKEVQKQGYMLMEGEHKRKDGTVFPVWVNVKYLSHGKKDYMVAIVRDITEWKTMEMALRNEKHDLEKLFNSLGDAVFVVKMPERVIEFVNNSVEPIFGYKPEECIGRFVDFFYPDIKEFQACAGKLEEAVRQGKDVLNIEQSLRRKNGEIFLSGITTTIFKKDGIVTRIVSIIRDITELKEAEERKISNQKRLTQEVAEILPGTFCIFDEDGHIEEWNKNFQTATGYSAEEISRMHPLDFFAEDDRENMAVKIREILAKGKAQAEAKVVSKEGRITPYFLMGNRICIDDRVYIIGMGVDITERKKMEQELLKMQKLDSLGILAGGIAHDFNNVLTAILGNISLAKMRTGPDDKISKTLTDAEKGCFRAKELTQQLITFSKGGSPVKRTASLIDLIKDSTTFTLSGSKTKPEFYIPANLWPVEADEGQLSQVINNLVLNADQAMPEGGIIEIRGENIILREKEIPSLKKGSYVKITVKDYGIGIAKGNLQKIFDPYFTTKQKGSGLGLATAYSIIRNHDGYISVESEIGKGTTFSIYLPASEKEAAKKEDVKRDYMTGSGRILIMDDEDIVRDVTGDILTMLGYEVDFAKDGKEAIELYKKAKESGKSFDVVIMDLTIPGGMGGKETVKKLLEIAPDVKAIVSSGYSSDPIMSEYKSYGFRGVVVKPYNTVELSRIVADVVKGRAG